jgi:1-pyrroline-5-carboxylate dehydrogenase
VRRQEQLPPAGLSFQQPPEELVTTIKITYATMSADNEELQASYDRGIEAARAMLDQDHPFFVNGEERWTDSKLEERSPIDSEIVIGRYSQGTAVDVNDAVAAAKAFAPDWAATPWEERVALIRKVGEVMESRTFELSALMAMEVGKNRLEALGDVAETVEFCRYYALQMEEHDGFVTPLGQLSPNEENVSVLRPYGVWAVISPFNFPMALAGGPTIGALITGNTVVLKPAHAGALIALELYRVMRDAGLPAGAFHVITGPGSEIGKALVQHPDVAGITFTGSYEVGMGIYKSFATEFPKPAVCEMGGKNPTIVTATANLDEAAEGVMRAAFGYSGQKCSACSRVYVEQPAYDEFVDRLVERTGKLVVGDPLDRSVYMGPVIDRQAVERFRAALTEVEDSGGKVLAGGEILTEGDLGRGNFVQPTVVSAPLDSWVWERELFMPFLAVAPVDSLDQALDLANDTEFGLTAGLFAGTEDEIERFFSRIQAGVTYVNRRAGATTGAWPNIQSFGGWKGSGTSGTGGGGPWYLRQYMREQSRTVVS